MCLRKIYLITILFFTFTWTTCTFDASDTFHPAEFIIYNAVIDSVFDSTYQAIFIVDSTRSLVHYIKKATLSEYLSGKKPKEYFEDLFDEKNCDENKEFISNYIFVNRKRLNLAEHYMPDGRVFFVPYTAIYYYRHDRTSASSPISRMKNESLKFGIISLSRVAFNRQKNEGIVEISVYGKFRTENLFIHLIRSGDQWLPQSNCYRHGPYSLKN